MNKMQTRNEALQKHYATLERLSAFLGKKQDGKKLSLMLWKIELDAHQEAIDYCNGDITAEQWDESVEHATFKLYMLFGKVPPGFFMGDYPLIPSKAESASIPKICWLFFNYATNKHRADFQKHMAHCSYLPKL